MNYPNSVMIVDDDADDRYIARYLLGKHWPQATLLEAVDGAAAIALLDDGKEVGLDLILLDINMPRVDGPDFLEQWYSSRGLKTPPVVVLTSSDLGSDETRMRAFDVVKDYIVKPLTSKTLSRLDGALDPAD